MASVSQFQTPNVQQGWSTQYHGTAIISGILYDLSNAILYTIYPTINFDVFLGIPLSIAQQFSVADRQLGGTYRNTNIPYPDDIYEQQVAGNFRQCLLLENGAPLLCENGDYITVN